MLGQTTRISGMKAMQKRTFLTTAAAVVAGAASALTGSPASAADKEDNTAEGLLKRLVKVQKQLEKTEDQIDEIVIPCSLIIPCDLQPEFLETLKSIETAAQDIIRQVDELRDSV
jgi:gas vesicle protein